MLYITGMKAKKENKKNVTIKLHPDMIRDLEAVCEKTGLKKNTIIEQGIRIKLKELN